MNFLMFPRRFHSEETNSRFISDKNMIQVCGHRDTLKTGRIVEQSDDKLIRRNKKAAIRI